MMRNGKSELHIAVPANRLDIHTPVALVRKGVLLINRSGGAKDLMEGVYVNSN